MTAVADDTKDTVILYQFGKNARQPSAGPFVMKLETYLRMNEIQFKNDYSGKSSKKGKIPWIKFNGECVADSQICMEYLNEKLGKNLDADLTPEQQAISTAFQRMVDEHLYWAFLLEMAYYLPTKAFSRMTGFPSIGIWFFKRKLKKYVHTQGIGRHSREESLKMIKEEFKAISDYLGSKPYFFGDKPTQIDCSIFGVGCTFFYFFGDEAPYKKMLQDEFPNLVTYFERIKDTYWKDWDERLKK